MPRKSAASVIIKPNVRCLRIYPTEDTRKTIGELQTVGFRLTRDQAVHLARVLLAVTQDWTHVDLTGRRFERRKSDKTYSITVTNFIAD